MALAEPGSAKQLVAIVFTTQESVGWCQQTLVKVLQQTAEKVVCANTSGFVLPWHAHLAFTFTGAGSPATLLKYARESLALVLGSARPWLALWGYPPEYASLGAHGRPSTGHWMVRLPFESPYRYAPTQRGCRKFGARRFSAAADGEKPPPAESRCQGEEVDLLAMSLADFIILSNSTFSWWAHFFHSCRTRIVDW